MMMMLVMMTMLVMMMMVVMMMVVVKMTMNIYHKLAWIAPGLLSIKNIKKQAFAT